MALGVGVAAGLGFAPSARANCETRAYEGSSPAVATAVIKAAEDLVSKGNYLDAYYQIARIAEHSYPEDEETCTHIEITGPNQGLIQALTRRANAVYALVLVQTSKKPDADKQLARMRKERPTDPVVRTRSAELLTLSANTRDAGRQQLEALAQQNLLADATGYATLARMQGDVFGNPAGQASALVRCRKLAKVAALCDRVPPPLAVLEAREEWESRMSLHQAAFRPERLSNAPDCKVVIHEESGTRTLDAKTWYAELALIPWGQSSVLVSFPRIARVEVTPKQGEVWEAEIERAVFDSVTNKGGPANSYVLTLRYRYQDDQVELVKEEHFVPAYGVSKAPR